MSIPKDILALIERERSARKQAEKILEAKSRELHEKKVELEALNTSLEEEVVDLIKDFLNLVSKHLYPRAKKSGNIEAMVYFLKLQGDYFRYVSEVSEGDRHNKGVERCLKCYNEGIELAEEL